MLETHERNKRNRSKFSRKWLVKRPDDENKVFMVALLRKKQTFTCDCPAWKFNIGHTREEGCKDIERVQKVLKGQIDDGVKEVPVELTSFDAEVFASAGVDFTL